LIVVEARIWERHYQAKRPYIVLINGQVLFGKKGPRTFSSESKAIKAGEDFLKKSDQKPDDADGQTPHSFTN
jgi:hypothetical protein